MTLRDYEQASAPFLWCVVVSGDGRDPAASAAEPVEGGGQAPSPRM